MKLAVILCGENQRLFVAISLLQNNCVIKLAVILCGEKQRLYLAIRLSTKELCNEGSSNIVWRETVAFCS